MAAVLRSVGRILLGVVGGLLLPLGSVGTVLRQPTLGKEFYIEAASRVTAEELRERF